MKLKSLLIAGLLASGASMSAQSDFINLTPAPKSMSVAEGSYSLPVGLTVGGANLSEEFNAEITKFINALNVATELNASASAQAGANVAVTVNTELASEGYNLTVTANGVTVEAATPQGLFYAFQTFKKILADNVMAGVKEDKAYSLPLVTIADEPRCEYRGFMLDVSRHFFTVDEVKRMLDVMSYYKLNTFHWHLTDDQGWRIEMPDYPRLQTVGATSSNVQIVDMFTKTEYWLNKPYGPYYYTQDQMREVVEYAANLHIEVIPEVDMPGHVSAVMAAYPEFSCTPNGGHSVAVTGGVYSDVLNVANPGAMKFVYDVCDVLIDIFPSETIHIGGDECPTNAWENNAECQAKYAKHKLTSYRQLQSLFIKDVAEYLAAKGKKLGLWNEAISASGANRNMVKDTGATIWCWTGADTAVNDATNLGLKAIYTPITASGANKGSFYINRSQNPNDPPANGTRSDDVKSVYQTIPFTTNALNKNPELCYGVQGTFWCERVAYREYLEYLALPRLLAIAEIGWTPQDGKDWESFQKRMSADRKLLDYNDYRYSPYHMLEEEAVVPDVIMPDPSTWYRVTATGTNRTGRVWEVTNEHHTASTHSSYGLNLLWSTDDVATESDAYYDYQWFRFEEDPANPGKYAIICKALPNGSVSGNATNTTNTGRFNYDTSTKHYDFLFLDDYYSTLADGNHNYALTSTTLPDGYHVNCAMAGQGFAINVWNNPADANGGIFTLVPAESDDSGVTNPDMSLPVTFTNGKSYIFENTAAAFLNTLLSDTGKGSLAHSRNAFNNNIWTVSNATANADGSQTFSLTNAITGNAVSSLGNASGSLAKPVNLGQSAAVIKAYRYSESTTAFMLAIGDDALWCMPFESDAPAVRAGANNNSGVSPMQGASWIATEAEILNFSCIDTNGNVILTASRGVPVNATDIKSYCPQIDCYELKSVAADENGVIATYEQVSKSVTYYGRLENGIYVNITRKDYNVNEEITLDIPEVQGCTLLTPGTLETDENGAMVVNSVYTSDAHMGVTMALNPVSEIVDGKAYLLRDAHESRNAFRCATSAGTVNGARSAENASPMFTWTLEANKSRYNVKNLATGTYIQALKQSTAATLGENAYGFTFTFDTDHWTVKGANGMYWDGNENLDMVGWNVAPGHPIEIYEFLGQPFYLVTVNSIDTEGNHLATEQKYALPGETFVVGMTYRAGYSIVSVDGLDALKNIAADATVTITYLSDEASSITDIKADADKSQAIYDLNGRRLNRITAPGIYIVNGQKILVR